MVMVSLYSFIMDALIEDSFQLGRDGCCVERSELIAAKWDFESVANYQLIVSN